MPSPVANFEASRSYALLKWYKLKASRRIDAVHLHHTFIPDIDLFNDISARLGTFEAGLELVRRMHHYHTKSLGWSDIAQHITVDPCGHIWIGRPFDKPPASASGYNGSSSSGPFMIEMIGNFDKGREKMPDAQRDAAETVVAAVIEAFNLQPQAEVIRFHSEMSSKSCPGSLLDKKNWIDGIKAKLKDRSTKRGTENPPQDANDLDPEVLTRLFVQPGARAAEMSADERLGEPPEHDMKAQDIQQLTRDVGLSRSPGASTRSGTSSNARLTRHMRDELQRHVINLEQGAFSDSGDFRSDIGTIDALVDQHLKNWIDTQLQSGEPAHIMLHAHGGINHETDGLSYAWDLHRWWLSQGIYPIYFVWETGILESVSQLIEEYMRTGERGLFDELKSGADRLRDAAVEKFVNVMARDFWTIMKISAARASSDSDKPELAGATYLAGKIARLCNQYPVVDRTVPTQIHLHAVGHSAGAIFHAHFLPRLLSELSKVKKTKDFKIESLSLLAAACTTDLFKQQLLHPINEERIASFNAYLLDRETEEADKSVPFYGKSLLHLVSNGFEKGSNVPLLGMEKFLLEDNELRELLGLYTGPSRKARAVIAPTAPGADTDSRSGAREHGDFSRDPETMCSVALSIHGHRGHDALENFPDSAKFSRGGNRAFAPLNSRIDDDVLDWVTGRALQATSSTKIDGEKQKLPQRPASVSMKVPGGRRIALCIGIDDYPNPSHKLDGCVNDADNWADCFRGLGFDVEMLTNRQASLSGVRDKMSEKVRSAGPDDVVAIHYSGHGVRFEDLHGDEDDRMDEALLPWDNDNKNFLSDDELWIALQDSRGQVYVFMDCCHSRSNTRAPRGFDLIPRLVVPDNDMRTAHAKRLATDDFDTGPKTIENMTHVKFSACADHEYAYESGGAGKFTTAAVAAIKALRHPISNHDFLLEIERRFEGDVRQQPGLECPLAMKNKPFLAGIPASTR